MVTYTLVEGGDMDVFWECDCEPPAQHKATQAVEKDRRCRTCGAYTDSFVDDLNEE